MGTRTAVLAAVLVAMLPLNAASGASSETAEELERTRVDLDRAGRDLTTIEHELDLARARIGEIEVRLSRATADLTAVRRDLEEAEKALAVASAREREAAADLQAANDELHRTVGTWEDNQEQLESRVAEIYKHGSSRESQLLMEGVARSRDLHSVSVTVRTVEGIVSRDRDLVRTTVELAKRAAAARSRVAEARATALQERGLVAAERDRVAGLVTAQERLVATIDQERSERAALVARIESDRSQQLLLVRQLEERVQALADELFQAVLTERYHVPFDGPMPMWAAGLPAHGRQWAPAINAASGAVGLDGRLFAAVVWTESNFHPAAVSPAGAIGLSQLMPGTAAGLGVDPWDPLENLSGGARYLRAQIVRFGQADLGLAAYNAGPGAVERAGNRIPDIVETQLYVLRVLERYERLLRAG